MRDLLVTLIVMGSLPIIFTRPHVGILMWAWISYMNPHRMSYGFAYSFPFAALIGACTLIALFTVSKERRPLPMGPLTIMLLIWVFWMNVTTFFALEPDDAAWGYSKVMKIQLMNFVTMMLIWGKDKIMQLIWVIIGSIVFFGVKGGIFTITSAGGALVWGPPGSDIQGNNELAVALIICVPLLMFLKDQVEKQWQKLLIWFSIFTSVIAVLGTFSRGAFLAILAMLFFLWLKSSKKFIGVIVLVMAIPAALVMMPDRYMDRMNTIENYEEDGSAMGRINAWWFAFHLANDRPLVGGGFNVFTVEMFRVYAPEPEDKHDAHSIYFEVLGEQGYVGLFIFLMLPLLTWLSCNWIRKHSKDRDDLKWAYSLATMIQVSMMGFGVGGAFLGLAYWDFIYHLMAIIVVTRDHLERTFKEEAEREAELQLEAKRQARLAAKNGEPISDSPETDKLDPEPAPAPAMAMAKEAEPEAKAEERAPEDARPKSKPEGEPRKSLSPSVPAAALPPSFRKT